MKNELFSIEVMPTKGDPLFELRESGVSHTPYEKEAIFYSYIKAGNIDKVKTAMSSFLENGIVVGRLSADNLRQAKYWAVCCVTLATRYAIAGGIDETDAFNLSDAYIQDIDKMQSTNEVIAYLRDKAMELTLLVAAYREKAEYPKSIRQCINYINKNLHGKISLNELAEVCHLSSDYLSKLFKKHTGEKISSYIIGQKLKAATNLLNGTHSYGDIAYYLGFSSESHFISCFKKAYGVTPKAYAKAQRYQG